MDSSTAAEAYRTASIENAPPVQIIRMLYQGALRFLEQALRSEQGPQGPEYTRLIGRADDIVVELRLCLNHDADPTGEISRNLERLYLYCEDELGRAIASRDSEHIESAKRILTILSDAWRDVERQTAQAAA